MIYADIIVDISSESIDKTFQYSIPEDLQSSVLLGTRVNIPFGNRKGMTGYVVGLSSVPKIEESKIKDILGIADKSIGIEERMLILAAWIKKNYGGTMNEALKTVLPVKHTVRPVVKKSINLLYDKNTTDELIIEAEKKHYVAKARLLKELVLYSSLSYELVNSKLSISPATINSLEKAGVIGVVSETVDRNNRYGNTKNNCTVALNDEQQAACDRITSDLDNGIQNTYLIHGITGSGKTEVYMNIIDKVISMGKKTIVLIPEIALTYQTVRRFTDHFGDRVAFFNSKMSAGERYDQYLKAKDGRIDIMIGPRSALFAPFSDLGLIVIDEEHEGAYKSEGVPKYHAREVAEQLCKMTGASLVLGSATPSLEAYRKAEKNEYVLLKLTKRAKTAVSPEVKIIDLREELENKNRTIFSRELVNDMADRLMKKEQIMLFLNRRGYSGFVSCRKCGEAMKCPHCSVSLTEHYDGTLKCHYCGYETKMPKTCPKCGSRYIAAFGTGTQKIEEGVKKLFPNARVLRMDADTTKNKDSYDKILSTFANEEADILIGTQMIVKGHDFPKVTLVGILAADISLHASDYRASERTFQLLAQAAGRAGRASLPGKVIIQTYKPDHYAILSAAAQDYEEFYRQEISYRKLLEYPPESHFMAILFIGKDEEKCKAACDTFAGIIGEKFEDPIKSRELRKIGPVAAGIAKVNDYYRNIVYFKSSKYDILSDICDELDLIRDSLKEDGVLFQVDFDPMNGY